MTAFTPIGASRKALPIDERIAQARPLDTHQQLVKVFDPEGKEQVVERHVANDLTRHCGWKWGSVDVKDKPAAVDAAPDAPVAPGEGGASSSGSSDEEPLPASTPEPYVDPAMKELEELRAEAAAVGVEVDQRWGKKRLREEIEKRTGKA
jgi:hypothetical protein